MLLPETLQPAAEDGSAAVVISTSGPTASLDHPEHGQRRQQPIRFRVLCHHLL